MGVGNENWASRCVRKMRRPTTRRRYKTNQSRQMPDSKFLRAFLDNSHLEKMHFGSFVLVSGALGAHYRDNCQCTKITRFSFSAKTSFSSWHSTRMEDKCFAEGQDSTCSPPPLPFYFSTLGLAVPSPARCQPVFSLKPPLFLLSDYPAGDAFQPEWRPKAR